MPFVQTYCIQSATLDNNQQQQLLSIDRTGLKLKMEVSSLIVYEAILLSPQWSQGQPLPYGFGFQITEPDPAQPYVCLTSTTSLQFYTDGPPDHGLLWSEPAGPVVPGTRVLLGMENTADTAGFFEPTAGETLWTLTHPPESPYTIIARKSDGMVLSATSDSQVFVRALATPAPLSQLWMFVPTEPYPPEPNRAKRSDYTHVADSCIKQWHNPACNGNPGTWHGCTQSPSGSSCTCVHY